MVRGLILVPAFSGAPSPASAVLLVTAIIGQILTGH